jgi:hypothetical protein
MLVAKGVLCAPEPAERSLAGRQNCEACSCPTHSDARQASVIWQNSIRRHYALINLRILKWMYFSPCRLVWALTRISHQISTAEADPGISTALRSVGLLYILSSMSAGLSVALAEKRQLRLLATKSGEKCGLICIRVNRRLWRRDSKRLCRSGVNY